MSLVDFRITRFQFARDRVIGDSQVRADDVNVAALELISSSGAVGLGFVQTLFSALPDQAEIARIFRTEVWSGLVGQPALGLVHRGSRPRGGNQRGASLPFHEALQVALWDLAAKQAGLPLHRMLGATRDRVRAFASGLDFHLDDAAFQALFAHAAANGYQAFKIKVGHTDFARDLHRLALLKAVVPAGSQIMVDANEAWSAKEALMKITAIRDDGAVDLHPPSRPRDSEHRRQVRGIVQYLLRLAGFAKPARPLHNFLRPNIGDVACGQIMLLDCL